VPLSARHPILSRVYFCERATTRQGRTYLINDRNSPKDYPKPPPRPKNDSWSLALALAQTRSRAPGVREPSPRTQERMILCTRCTPLRSAPIRPTRSDRRRMMRGGRDKGVAGEERGGAGCPTATDRRINDKVRPASAETRTRERERERIGTIMRERERERERGRSRRRAVTLHFGRAGSPVTARAGA